MDPVTWWQSADLLGRLVVAGTLAVAAVLKLADLPGLRATLYLSRWTRSWVPQLSVTLPVVELALAAALLGSTTGRPAAAVAVVLLAAFIVYLTADRTAGQGCDCFGRRSRSSRGAGIVRDVVLIGLLSPGLLMPALVRGTPDPAWGVPADLEPWADGAAVVVIAGLVIRAFRRAERGRRREGRPPAPATGPAVRRAPDLDLATPDGDRVRLDDVVVAGGGVLVFVEPGCGVCELLVPSVTERPDAYLVVAARDPDEVSAWAKLHEAPASQVLVDVDGVVADRYGLTATPGACRVDGGGVLVDAAGRPAARLAVGVDAVRDLLRPRSP
jgi:hypothetical protein